MKNISLIIISVIFCLFQPARGQNSYEGPGIAIETVNNTPFLSDEEKRDIFYNNAARFLDLSENIIAEHHQ